MNQVVYQAGLEGRMTAGKTNRPRAGTSASRGWRARKASPSAAVATAQAPAQVSRTNSVVTWTGAACSLIAVRAAEAAAAISDRVSPGGDDQQQRPREEQDPAHDHEPEDHGDQRQQLADAQAPQQGGQAEGGGHGQPGRQQPGVAGVQPAQRQGGAGQQAGQR